MQDRVEQLGHEIAISGGRTIVVEADVTDKSQAQAAVEQTVATLGWLDILVRLSR